ncbi:cell division protein FtsW [Bifidobacterium goeldii]|uniref:Probable peptidoglycan glycosyltransferase FtsW n=1 Tax=Bifidobacterium goeldii TaxID=2306975 RepID=A0A430FN56_9BIFI|nr:putative peptidoglycan glycosyltransferase FtsW [Bifidobacterium goeldii]RSX54257.1 cell division protein FtsW [Bifidobacterium goeldii]
MDDDIDVLSRYTGIRSLLNPLWCYHGFRAAVVVLTCFGVIMVFSSSTVSMVAAGASPFKQAISQGMYCVLGMIVGVLLMCMPAVVYKRLGFGALVFAIFLQMLTFTPLGVEVNGNAGWIGKPGVFTMQPAEVTKLALCIWLPSALHNAKKLYTREGLKAYAVPSALYVLCLGLVMMGKDLGTGMIVLFIGFVAFLLGGFPVKYLAGLALLGVVGVGALVVTSPNRLNRVLAAYQDCTGDAIQGVCYQSMHARYALASGGLLGVGIGNSREKWNYLPEAHNDFIFAIIGEETGFVGAAIVIVLFVVLGWCMISVALQTKDRYVSISLLCITVWIVGQALVNIGVVVGVFPVMGVPMPFVSAGGSSLIMCLAAAGVAASLMRSQPQIKADSSKA